MHAKLLLEYLGLVGAVHESVMQHKRCSVRKQRVTLHFTKANASIALTTL